MCRRGSGGSEGSADLPIGRWTTASHALTMSGMYGMSDTHVECRICGTAIRAMDETHEVGGSSVHASCAPSGRGKKSRKDRRLGGDTGTRIGIARSVNSWR